MTITRPDICFAVNRVLQFMHAPKTNHMEAAKRIVRYVTYVKGTITHGIRYVKVNFMFHKMCATIACSFVDCAGDYDSRRSISGYCVYLGENLVSCKSRRIQSIGKYYCRDIMDLPDVKYTRIEHSKC